MRFHHYGETERSLRAVQQALAQIDRKSLERELAAVIEAFDAGDGMRREGRAQSDMDIAHRNEAVF